MRSILRFRSNRRAFSGECLNSTVARISKLTPAVNAIRFIFDAMKKIDPDQEDYSLGHPGQVITQLHPDFDPYTSGSAQKSDLFGVFSVLKGREKT